MERIIFKDHDPKLVGRKVRVIDPNYPEWLDKEFYLIGTRQYTLRSGEVSVWYQISQNPNAIICDYMGRNQIEFID